MIEIRRAKHEDIPQLEVLFQLTRQDTFVSRPKDVFQIGDYQRSTADDEVWVAEKNNIIVGFVSIYFADNFIHNLFVHPLHQRCNIGEKLLQVAEENLKRPIILKIAMDNLKACGFYEKYGWHPVSVHKEAEEPYLLYRKE